jgi:ABC-type Fe3+ transport system substrate-binding protein
MEMQNGADFVRRFKGQNIRTYNVTGRALANFVISGEVALSPTIYNSHVIASKAAGAMIEWVAPGPVAVNDSAVALAARAPHPNAMLLLVDFLLSPEGQALYESLGYNSPRRDRQNPSAQDLQKVYLSAAPDFEQRFNSWSRLYEEVFP